jgi:hypothetical protein
MSDSWDRRDSNPKESMQDELFDESKPEKKAPHHEMILSFTRG